MAGCCEPPPFEGGSTEYKRALWAVIAINAVMFCVEISAGLAADSQALKADALDFAGDTVTYALSLFVIGASIRTRALASLFKAASLGTMALVILVLTVLRFFDGATPDAQTIGSVGLLALLANVTSVLILLRWRDGTGSAWPDLLVGALLAGLFLRSSSAIFSQALSELNSDQGRRSEADGVTG